MGNLPPARLKGAFWILFLAAFPRTLFAEAPQPLNPTEVARRFQQLENQMAQLQGELSSLKKQVEIKGPEEKTVYLPPSPNAGPKWLEGLEMGGDFRLRYEGIDHNEATRDQNRFRYRLRWKTEKHLTPNLDLGFRLVSGSTTDPTATNQTFTGDATFKSFLIDQAYAKYRPAFLTEHFPYLSKAEIAGGKFENPFFGATTSMVWDPDVTPEGFYESLEWGFLNKKFNPFVTTGQFILQESATLSDSEMYGVQTGVRWTPPGFSEKSEVKITNAFAYYNFSDFARDSNFTVGGVSLARGNTPLGSTNLAAGDFNILQFYNDIKFKMAGVPLKFFGDFAFNAGDQTPDPDNQNKAYEYGLRLGEAKKKGSWEATYAYAYIEPNAVVGAFSESDFGNGFANKRGSLFGLKYKLTDAIGLAFRGSVASNVTGVNDETKRFQTDLEWVF